MPLLNVQAVIDDFAALPAIVEGKSVTRLEDTPDNALVINCVTNSKPATAMKRLRENHRVHPFYGADLQAVFHKQLPPYDFVAKSQASFRNHPGEWEKLYQALADRESQSTLEDVVAYRLTGDPRVLSDYSYRPRDQYFEDFLEISDEVFIDGGAFDGETTEIFLSKYPKCRRAIVFEPDPGNFTLAVQRLGAKAQVEFYPVGLSNAMGKLRFSVGGGSSSVVAEHGDLVVSVDTIDRLAPDATLIKLDLEGWELNALKGAEGTIKKNKPKLAVGAYHHPDDFLRIYKWVTSLRVDYKVSMRHYTESWTETVMYFH